MIKFKFFEKENLESEVAKRGSIHEPEGLNCSFCYDNLEESLKFRINQLRSFKRQLKRLDSKTVIIGKHHKKGPARQAG